MKLKVGDSVVVLTGKDKGQSGAILKIDKKNDRVMVSGLFKQIKHVKRQGGNPGERIEKFGSIHISNVAVIDPKTKKPTRIGYKQEGSEKVRFYKASGEAIKGKVETTVKSAPKASKKVEAPEVKKEKAETKVKKTEATAKAAPKKTSKSSSKE